MTGNHPTHGHFPLCPPHVNSTAASPDHATGEIVPIAVWRLDPRAGHLMATDPAAAFAARLARRLVLTYTRPGDTLVDFDNDPHLRTAAVTTLRPYLPVPHGHPVGWTAAPAGLVIMRWPRPAHTGTRAHPTSLFTRCRHLMNADTCVIIAITASATPDRPDATHAHHRALLAPAVRAAGLVPVLQIVAVGGAHHGDQFLYYATAGDVETARRQPNLATSCHVDLLVLRPINAT